MGARWRGTTPAGGARQWRAPARWFELEKSRQGANGVGMGAFGQRFEGAAGRSVAGRSAATVHGRHAAGRAGDGAPRLGDARGEGARRGVDSVHWTAGASANWAGPACASGPEVRRRPT
jgi:hypothetical protein